MRKNSIDRTGIGGLYTTFEIKGVNLDRFINYAKKQGLTLYDVKKISIKRLLVTVNFKESRKFFAIADKMCYNVKRIRYKGWAYPFFRLVKSIGLLVGALVFMTVSVIFDDFIVGIKFSGSGSIYHRQVKEYLKDNGVCEFSRFSSVDLKVLEDKVLSDNPHLSFVSLKKSGNTLNVELALSSDNVKTLSGDVYFVKSDVNGEIERIKVYRGTALVSAGDQVNVGDLLVDGVVTLNDQTLKTNVICSVSIIVSQEREYAFEQGDAEQKAVLLAESEFFDKEILCSFVNKTQTGGGYLYKVLIKYRRVLCVG